jgi:tRNA A37 threonylcarbamoyltransferase TsaD
LDQIKKRNETVTDAMVSQIAYAFQEAACKALVTKTTKAATLLDVSTIALV